MKISNITEHHIERKCNSKSFTAEQLTIEKIILPHEKQRPKKKLEKRTKSQRICRNTER